MSNRYKTDPEYREMVKARTKAWRLANKEKVRVTDYAKHLKRKYGITIDEYNEMAANQNHVCAICLKPELMRCQLSVDHCHSTGRIRGLLCFKCNTSINIIENDHSALARISHYLGVVNEQ